MRRASAMPVVTARTFGILADGAFKILLAARYALAAGPRLADPVG